MWDVGVRLRVADKEHDGACSDGCATPAPCYFGYDRWKIAHEGYRTQLDINITERSSRIV
jgi:hypothetical protein